MFGINYPGFVMHGLMPPLPVTHPALEHRLCLTTELPIRQSGEGKISGWQYEGDRGEIRQESRQPNNGQRRAQTGCRESSRFRAG